MSFRARGVLQPGSRSRGVLQVSAVTNQTMEPDSIGPTAAFDDPTLQGENQAMQPGSIGPDAAFDDPTLVQDFTVQPLSIGPTAAFDAPTFVGDATVLEPLSIGPTAAFDDPTISNIQTMEPGSIGPTAAFDDPTLTPGADYMRPESIGPTAAFGAPTLEGGDQSLGIFIGGFNRTEYLKSRTADLDSQTLGRWTASFTLYNVPGGDDTLVGTDEEWTPQVGQTVIIREFGRKLFAGCISEIKDSCIISRIGNLETDVIVYECRALDKSSICDHKIVRPITFTADQDGADVVRLVVVNNLAGEGIEIFGVPASMGLLGAEIPVNFWNVTQVFDQISTLTGFDWFVDINGILTWVDQGAANPAPFDIAPNSQNFRSLRVTRSLVDFRTTSIVVSNRTVLPGDGSDQATAARTETFVIPYAPSVAAGLSFGALITSLPILQIVSIKVNTISKEFHTGLFETPPVDINGFWWYFPGNVYITAPVTGPDIPSNGDIVEVQYVPFGQQAAVQSDAPLVVQTPPSPPPGESFGTCGTGIYEVVEQVTDVTSEDDLRAIAAALQSRSGLIPTIVEYETDFPGLYVGMTQNAQIPRYHLDDVDLFIVSVRGQHQGLVGGGDVPGDLGHGSGFRWNIRAMNTRDLGKWSKWWERLIRRTQHARPITTVDAVTFVLAPGASLAGGTNITNPEAVKTSGRLADAIVLSDNPPEDQDLVIDILYDGVSIFQSGNKLELPAGDTDLQRVTVFAQPAFYIFKDHKVRCNVSYRVTGANPVNARSVTVKLRVEV